MNKFYSFLDGIQKAVNISEIERVGQMGKSLSKHYSWKKTGIGYPLPDKHIPAIFAALCGFHTVVYYDGWLITFDKEIMSFFVERPTGKPDASKDKKDHFTYTRELYKEVYAFAEFSEWIILQEKYV